MLEKNGFKILNPREFVYGHTDQKLLDEVQSGLTGRVIPTSHSLDFAKSAQKDNSKAFDLSGERMNFFLGIAGSQSKSDPNTIHTIGYLVIPYEYLPDNLPLKSAKKDVVILLDSCPGYYSDQNKNAVYKRLVADKHIDYMLKDINYNLQNIHDLIGGILHSSDNPLLASDIRYDISKNAVIVLPNKDRLKELLVEDNQKITDSNFSFKFDIAVSKNPQFFEELLASLDSFMKKEEETNKTVIAQQGPREPLDDILDRSARHNTPDDKDMWAFKQQEFEDLKKQLANINVVPTKNFLSAYYAMNAFVFGAKLQLNSTDKSNNPVNERLLVISGPPGVGKTFAVQAFLKLYEDKVACAEISGNANDMDAVKRDLIGTVRLEGNEHGGTSTKFEAGQFAKVIGKAISENKDHCVIFYNEFNRNIGLNEFDKFVRSIGDSNRIDIDPEANLDEVANVLITEYNIVPIRDGNRLVIDLNNVDGHGKKVNLSFILTGNFPDKDLTAADLQVSDQIPLALSRRSYLVKMDYFDPRDKDDAKQIKSMIYHNGHFLDTVSVYSQAVAKASGFNEQQTSDFVSTVRQALLSENLDIIRQKYGEKAYLVTDAFVGENGQSSLYRNINDFYTKFYTLYKNGKTTLVPAISEIAMEMQQVLDIVAQVNSSELVSSQIKKSFVDFLYKEETVSKAFPPGSEEEEGMIEMIQFMSDDLFAPADLYNYVLFKAQSATLPKNNNVKQVQDDKER